MKRYVLKRKSRFFTFLALMLLTIIIFTYATTVYAYKERSYKTVFIKQGDTLWNIALKHKKQGDIRRYIYELKKINNLKGGEIYAGDVLLVP